LTIAEQTFTVTQPGVALLSTISAHMGNFTQGQNGATYTVTVSNAVLAGPTAGTVTATDTLPAGMTLVSMTGGGWSCVTNTCSRSDVLNPGASYPFITVTVNVAANAISPQVNSVSVSGGSSATSADTDSTVIFTPVIAVSVSPTSGSGSTASLTATYSDTAGYTDLAWTLLLVNSSLNGSGACYVAYQQGSNSFYLANDTGTGWMSTSIPAGSSGSVQNSQCTLNGTGSSVSGSGTGLSMTVSVTFLSGFTGAKTVYLYGLSAGGQNSGWQSRGAWTAQ
jgi:uncharacterized repeat protein (TIGR01451 family)